MGNTQQKRHKRSLQNKILKQFPKLDHLGNLRSIIVKCINYKLISYYRFLITKIAFKYIKHKKIVQKVFSNYLPNYALELYFPIFQDEILGGNEQNIKYLGESLKNLRNLHHLKLTIRDNNPIYIINIRNLESIM